MLVITEDKPGEGMTFQRPNITGFKSRFRQIRKDLKLNQAAMAEYLGVSLTTVQRYEKGTSFPTTDILKSVAALGVDLHWLITGTSSVTSICPKKETDVVYFTFRSTRFKQINEMLEKSGMTMADLHFIMDKHLHGIVDGLKHLNQKPF